MMDRRMTALTEELFLLKRENLRLREGRGLSPESIEQAAQEYLSFLRQKFTLTAGEVGMVRVSFLSAARWASCGERTWSPGRSPDAGGAVSS